MDRIHPLRRPQRNVLPSMPSSTLRRLPRTHWLTLFISTAAEPGIGWIEKASIYRWAIHLVPTWLGGRWFVAKGANPVLGFMRKPHQQSPGAWAAGTPRARAWQRSMDKRLPEAQARPAATETSEAA